MPTNLRADDCALLVVDLQPSFLAAIHESERVLSRSEFLIRIARLLDVPVLATEQYPERMGQTEERIARLLGVDAQRKMAFSCAGCGPTMEALKASARSTVVLVGIETHICVSQTAHDLMEFGYGTVVCGDAVSARTADRHMLGIERIRSAGAVVAHTESVAYEWMQTAEHGQFREALAIVKSFG